MSAIGETGLDYDVYSSFGETPTQASPQYLPTEFLGDILHFGAQNTEFLAAKFDEMEAELRLSKNPIAHAKKFLESSIKGASKSLGSNISTDDVCKLLKENLESMDVTEESKDQILRAIDYFGQEEHGKGKCQFTHVKLPFHSKNGNEKVTAKIHGIVPFLIGLVEAGVGAAIVTVNPVVGGILIADGASRVISGISENIEGNGISFPF